MRAEKLGKVMTKAKLRPFTQNSFFLNSRLTWQFLETFHIDIYFASEWRSDQDREENPPTRPIFACRCSCVVCCSCCYLCHIWEELDWSRLKPIGLLYDVSLTCTFFYINFPLILRHFNPIKMKYIFLNFIPSIANRSGIHLIFVITITTSGCKKASSQV